MYKCPVCNKRLRKENNTYKCLEGHSFDVNKKGYVNLLLANQARSNNPGDSKEMIDARTLFLNKGYYSKLRDELFNVINKYLKNNEVFCDLACGEGYYTHYIHKKLLDKNVVSYGVDLSRFGIGEATRKMRIENINNIFYSIGNLMYLPYMDESMNVVLNCFAPFFEKEYARIIKKDGYFVRVLPNELHMYELKKMLYKEVKLNENKETELTYFTLEDEIDLSYQEDILSSDDLLHLFMMTPLYYKSSLDMLEKLKSIDNLRITLSFKILVYKKI